MANANRGTTIHTEYILNTLNGATSPIEYIELDWSLIQYSQTCSKKDHMYIKTSYL